MFDRKNFRDSMRTMASPASVPASQEPAREIFGVIPLWLLPIGVGLITALVVLAVVIGTGDGYGSNRTTIALATQVADIEHGLTTTPTGENCLAATNYLDIIAQQEAAAQWDAAFTTTQTALQLSGLCDTDRRVLAGKAVANGLAAIWALPSTTPADFVAQETAVARYETVQRLSTSYDVPFPLSERQVAGEAYKVSQFLLAKTAMEHGFEAGRIDRHDQLQIAFYHDSVYNLGWWLAHHAADERRNLGLALLATAAALDERYDLGRSLAAEELRRLVDRDPSRWPRPLASPLLQTTPEVTPLPTSLW